MLSSTYGDTKRDRELLEMRERFEVAAYRSFQLIRGPRTGESKASPSTVAALFSKMALTGQRIAMVDMVFLVLTAFPYLP